MNDFVELRQILTKILNKWWLVLLCTGLAGLAGYIYSSRQAPIFEATTSLIVGQTIQNRDVNRGDIETSYRVALTYADIARRQPVLQATVDALGLSETLSWKTLRKQMRVEPVEDTQLLEITVGASSSTSARGIADEIARQLILLSPASLQGLESEENKLFREERLEALRNKIQEGERRLEILQSSDITNAPIEQIVEIQGQINTLEQLIIGWQSNYSTLLNSAQASKSSNDIAIVEPAQSSSTPVYPKPITTTLIASILGFLTSLGLIFVADFLDDSLKPEDISPLFGIPVLGNISRITGANPQERMVINQPPFSPSAEDYRLLRSKIQFLPLDGPRSFLVASPEPGQGRSTTVANLGVVMAQAGFRTIIVDADLRHPMQHQIFDLPNEGGLGQLLRYPDLKPNSYLKRTAQVLNLRILNSGTLPPLSPQAIGNGLPPSPSELLGSARMEQLLSDLGDLADVVILDSPPAVSMADAAVLANQVSGVLLILETNFSKRASAGQAFFNLQQAQANILGIVFNRTNARHWGIPGLGRRRKRAPDDAPHPRGIAEPIGAEQHAAHAKT